MNLYLLHNQFRRRIKASHIYANVLTFGFTPNLFATTSATRGGDPSAQVVLPELAGVRCAVAQSVYPWPLVAPSEQLPASEVAGEVPILHLSGHLLTPSASPLPPQLRVRLQEQHWSGYWGQGHLVTR